MRYTDPRRFGAILWTKEDPQHHALIRLLGVDPLNSAFSADMLFCIAQKRSVAIKSLIMNAHVVVGVDNIYATEALFLAKIHPACPAKLLTIKHVLQHAI